MWQKGLKHSTETRAKMSAAHKGRKGPRGDAACRQADRYLSSNCGRCFRLHGDRGDVGKPAVSLRPRWIDETMLQDDQKPLRTAAADQSVAALLLE
jgi:NUMOD3 motif